MSVKHVQDIVIRAVVELADRGLITMLRGQIPAVLFMAPTESVIDYRFDTHNARMAIMKRCRLHELVSNLVALGAQQAHILTMIARPLGRPFGMPAPAGLREAEILAPAIPCDPLRALLLRRTVRVLHADGALFAALDEGQPVEPVHKVPGHWDSEDRVRLLELALDDLHLEAIGVPRRMPPKEAAHVAVQLLVREVSVQQADPEHRGRGTAHEARPIGRHRDYVRRPLCGPTPGFQHSLELIGLRSAEPISWALRQSKPQDVDRQDLRWRRDHIVGALGHPDVIPVKISLAGGLDAERQAAHQHVLPTPAVAHGYVRALGKVLACTVNLPATSAAVEAVLADGDHVVGVGSMEALQLIGRSAEASLQLRTPGMETPGQQRVVHPPCLEKAAMGLTLLPKCLQVGQLAGTAAVNRHALRGWPLRLASMEVPT
mmetsp:Transcript_130455/g.363472  ORF Transcript_130455/g.363472 Transcript_130455/m.363472 type:complete len:432 (-) Transcript_130455:1427-2722(-)